MHGFFYGVQLYYYITSNIDQDHLIRNAPFDFKGIKNICNGLILCSYLPMYTYVRNPATKMSARIPVRMEDANIVMITVACDPLLSCHFYVVGYRVTTKIIHVFSSKTGERIKGPRQSQDGWLDSWRWPKHSPVFFAGIVHVLYNHTSSMLEIDPERVTCEKTDLHVTISNFNEHRLGLSSGKMHYALRKRMDIHVFVMEDYETNRWRLQHTINLKRMVKDLDLQNNDYYEIDAEEFIKDLDRHGVILAFHPDLDEVFLSLLNEVLTCNLHDAALTVDFHMRISASTFWIYSPCYVEDLDLECVIEKNEKS